ncbi:MAG TPA: AI-2E family transporter [Candidatus Dormibacteraeota bacterium]|nr:AI-2E family transporter [Candidatus Dormibacteraeota bacterium]
MERIDSDVVVVAAVRPNAGATSVRILAAGAVILFLYYASGVVITLMLSILLAYFLDPAVELMERTGLPRTLAAMVIVLVLIVGLLAVGYAVWARTSDFANEWPKYSAVLRQVQTNLEGKLNGLEGQITPQEAGARAAAQSSGEGGMVHGFIMRSIGSLYELVLEVTFVPFLVFFMLAGKRDTWHSTLRLFPVSARTQVKETLDDLRMVLRDYLAGMCILTLIVIAASSVFFWALGLEYPIMLGIVSGLLNMVPYIGVVLSWVPAFVLALAKYNTVGWFLLIAAVLLGVHICAMNLIAPHIVGKRVQLNAVAITIALLFWGWLWGGMGLLLAIPLTAVLRVVCDHIESLKPMGRWLAG